MEEVRTIQFVDAETKESAVAVVRVAMGIVGFCLSLEEDGDIEVFLGVDDCRTLVAAINEALVLASST